MTRSASCSILSRVPVYMEVGMNMFAIGVVVWVLGSTVSLIMVSRIRRFKYDPDMYFMAAFGGPLMCGVFLSEIISDLRSK